MDFICFDGIFLPANEPVVTSENRSFRYGDGVFETIKIYNGQILFEQFHFERLFLSLKMLHIKNTWDALQLSQFILELCTKNNCKNLAKVRLAFYRKDQNKAGFIIESFYLNDEVNRWNERGLAIDIYPYSRKSPDAFSNLKTANFLPYVLADLFAKEKGIDDAIVLNAFNYIADSSRANIFLIKNNEITTPALHQGCISGVMRRFLLAELKKNNYRIHQQEVSEQDLYDADEIFLSNSIFDIRWVDKFRNKKYPCEQIHLIYQNIIASLY